MIFLFHLKRQVNHSQSIQLPFTLNNLDSQGTQGNLINSSCSDLPNIRSEIEKIIVNTT